MKSLFLARSAALVAAFGAAAAMAQVTPRVLTDAAPLPAEERSSNGAVMMAEEPVIAQAQFIQVLARSRDAQNDTTMLGAPPAPKKVAPQPKARKKAAD